MCVSYEYLALHPERAFRRIFNEWSIPYDERILKWNTKLGEGTIKADGLEDQRAKLERHVCNGLHNSLLAGLQTYHLVKSEMILTSDEISKVNRQFQKVYEEISSSSEQHFSNKDAYNFLRLSCEASDGTIASGGK
jgi:hypothetical protein